MKLVTRILVVISFISFVEPQEARSDCPPHYIFTSDASNRGFGNSVAPAGDVNNDGYDDLIVGAEFSNLVGSTSGRAFVFSGLNGDTLYAFTGEAERDRFGNSVASAGDVNNDGYSDLIIGARYNDFGGSNAGRVYVFSGFNGDTLHIFTGEREGDEFGRSVASAGDVNNDGYSDLIVGANLTNANGSTAGRAYVFSGLNGDTLYVFTGEAEIGLFGNSVASAGDVNNDGYSDLIVGAYLNVLDDGSFDSGRAYVFSGLNGDTLYVFKGEDVIDGFGWSVASAGDVNNDGYADLIVSTKDNDAGRRNSGRVYVFSGLNGDTLFVFTGEGGGTFGDTIASAGDVNGDGHADLIISAPFFSNTGVPSVGRTYVFSGMNGDALFVFTGESRFDEFGSSVASAGDVNNDGFADMIVGAWRNDEGGNNAGRAYVFLGTDIVCGDVNSDGFVTPDDLTFLINFYFSFGESPCGFGSDVNNDGSINLADIVYLAQYLNNNGPAPCAGSEPPPLGFDPKKKPEGRQTGSGGF